MQHDCYTQANYFWTIFKQSNNNMVTIGEENNCIYLLRKDSVQYSMQNLNDFQANFWWDIIFALETDFKIYHHHVHNR